MSLMWPAQMRMSSFVRSGSRYSMDMVVLTDPKLDTASLVTSVAVSPTGAYIAAGDSDGTIHMLSQAAEEEEEPLPFNGFDGKPIEWADPPEPLQEIEWDDNT